MISRWTRCCLGVGLLVTVQLVGNARAHPITQPEGTPIVGIAQQQTEAAAVARVPAGTRPSVVADTLGHFRSAVENDGRPVSPSNLASGSDRVSSESWPGRLVVVEDGNSGVAGIDPSDALSTLRPMVDGKTQPIRGSSLSRQATSDPNAASDAGERIAALVLEFEGSVVEVLTAATDARIDPDGKVTFSLAGIEGFHYAARGGELSFGHGDASLAIVQPAAGSLEQRMEQRSARGPQPLTPPAGSNPAGEVWQLLKEILQYPLVWLLLLLLLVGKVALLVARYRARRRTRRSGSGNRHARLKVRRTRLRHRIKRVASSASLQEQ